MFVKKLLLVILILAVLFIVAVFKAPGVSNMIESLTGFEGLSDQIKGVKSTVDNVSTDIPTLDEVKDGYSKAYSGAIDAKDALQDGIKDTKDFIDSTRKTLSGAEAIYNDAKGVYEETKNVIDGVQDKIDTAKTILDDGAKLQETLSDNLNKEILE